MNFFAVDCPNANYIINVNNIVLIEYDLKTKLVTITLTNGDILDLPDVKNFDSIRKHFGIPDHKPTLTIVD